MIVISAGRLAGEEHLRRTEELLRPAGKVLRIPGTRQDAATALSGSGPAYVYYLVEAMADAGILLGIPRGSRTGDGHSDRLRRATMLRESGEHPVLLREAVTSPAGTTAPAVREPGKHRVRAAILAAIETARDRGGNRLTEPAAQVYRTVRVPAGPASAPCAWTGWAVICPRSVSCRIRRYCRMRR